MAITYDTITQLTVSANTSSIVLSSIPSTYTDLVLKMWVPASTVTGDNYDIRFNGDTGNNYNIVRGLSNYPSATGDYQAGAARIYGVLGSTGYATVGTWDIFNYASNKYKTILHKGSTYNVRSDMIAATWASTSAINSITIFQDSTGLMTAVTKISLHVILRA